MALHTFDPGQVIITVGGAQINGFADGTFVTLEPSSDMFQKFVGTDGEVTRVKSNDKSGTLTITLTQGSNANAILNALALQDEVKNEGVVAVQVKDLSGTSTFFAGEGWIRKSATAEYGKAATNRVWTIDMATVEMNHGVN